MGIKHNITKAMNQIPEPDWVSTWEYGKLKDEDGVEVTNGAFFTYQDIPVWRCVNQLSALHNDINPIDYNLKIIDRIIQALYNGDWITQMVAISRIEEINCFDPDYTRYIRWITSEDCTYNSWITEREQHWDEAGFTLLKGHANFALWRLEHYGEQPDIQERENDLSVLQMLMGDRVIEQHVFENPFNIDDYKTGYDDVNIDKALHQPAVKNKIIIEVSGLEQSKVQKPLLPSPVKPKLPTQPTLPAPTARAAQLAQPALPVPTQTVPIKSPPIVIHEPEQAATVKTIVNIPDKPKSKKEKIPNKGVQQTLF